MHHVDEVKYPHVAAAIAAGDTELVRKYSMRGAQAVAEKHRKIRARLIEQARRRGDMRTVRRLEKREQQLAEKARKRREAEQDAEAWAMHDAMRVARERQQRIVDWYAANYHVIPPPSACGD